MDAQSLIGTWRLVSIERSGVEPEERYPFGRQAIGNLTFTGDGYVSAILMSAEWASGGKEPEALRRPLRFLPICGTFDVIGNRVVVHLIVGSGTEWAGSDLVFAFRIEGNRLSMWGPLEEAARGLPRCHLVWARA